MDEFYSPQWLKEMVGFIVAPIPAVLILLMDSPMASDKHLSLIAWLQAFRFMAIITYYYYACGLIPLIIVYLFLKYTGLLSKFSLIFVGIVFSFIVRGILNGGSLGYLPVTILLGVASGYTLAFFTVKKNRPQTITE